MPSFALLARRYLRRSTFLIVVTLFGILYLVFADSPAFTPTDELDTVAVPTPRDPSIVKPPGSYGLSDLKLAMASRFGQGSHASGSSRHGRTAQLSPRDKFTCDNCLSDPERCSIYGS